MSMSVSSNTGGIANGSMSSSMSDRMRGSMNSSMSMRRHAEVQTAGGEEPEPMAAAGSGAPCWQAVCKTVQESKADGKMHTRKLQIPLN